MRFDDVFKRCFAVVVCFLLGAAAYFQASAAMSFFGPELERDIRLAPKLLRSMIAGMQPSRSPGRIAEKDNPAKSAASILQNNPFDSTRRSLLGGEVGPADDPAAATFGADPFKDPICDVERVVLISASEDPEWSFAAIAGGDQKPVLRRLGDEVSGQLLLAVARDRVWLASSRSRCQAVLGAAPAPGSAHRLKDADGHGTTSITQQNKPNPGVLPLDIASQIRKTGERSFEVDRSAIQAVMERQSELLGRVRVVPEREGGRVVGLRLTGVRPGSLLGSIGIENGDRLTHINGMELSDPQAALEAYARLSSANHLVVSVERRGAPLSIDVKIK